MTTTIDCVTLHPTHYAVYIDDELIEARTIGLKEHVLRDAVNFVDGECELTLHHAQFYGDNEDIPDTFAALQESYDVETVTA